MRDNETQYDVLVAGGGLAGAAAAVAAGRAGARTALIEKSFVLGGRGTAGLITWYSPLCDAKDTQVTFGLAEEFLHAGHRYGPGWVYGGWHDKERRRPGSGRYHSHFAPVPMMLALEELLLDAGILILYDTRVCQPVVEGDRVVGLEAENRDGRVRLNGRCTVDATGCALVAHRAGAPCDEAPEQGLVAQIYEASLEACREAVEKGLGTGIGRRSVRCPGGARYSGARAADATSFVLDARRALREHYAQAQAELGENGRQNLYPVLMATVPQIRKTRRIQGEKALRWSDHKKEIEDSVGLTANWYTKHNHEVWQIPYGVLLPRKVKGLLAPGRNASSADGRAWDMLRIIHCCVLTGEVAGVAGAMAAEMKTTPDALDVKQLQGRLRRFGFPLSYPPEKPSA
jgi:hypothetical protein